MANYEEMRKAFILRDWTKVCIQVKRGLKRLGHDIYLVPDDGEKKRGGKGGKTIGRV